MSDKFVVDILVFENPPEPPDPIALREHRIKFEGRKIKVLNASGLKTVREYDCSLLFNEPLKHPDAQERGILSIQLANSAGIELVFNYPNPGHVGIVVEEFNKFLEANIDHVQQKRVKPENVSTVDPQQSTTLSETVDMTDKFVVDVMIFAYPTESSMLVTLKDHRVKFERRTIKVLEASSFETIREYDCSLIVNKPFEHPGERDKIILSIYFAKRGLLDLAFNNSNREFVGYVIETFNKFLDANKDHVQQKVTKYVPPVVPQRSTTPSVPIKKRGTERSSEIGKKQGGKQTLIRSDNAIDSKQQNERIEDLNPKNEVVSNGDSLPVEQNGTVLVRDENITDEKDAFSAIERNKKKEVEDVRKSRNGAATESKIGAIVEEDYGNNIGKTNAQKQVEISGNIEIPKEEALFNGLGVEKIDVEGDQGHSVEQKEENDVEPEDDVDDCDEKERFM